MKLKDSMKFPLIHRVLHFWRRYDGQGVTVRKGVVSATMLLAGLLCYAAVGIGVKSAFMYYDVIERSKTIATSTARYVLYNVNEENIKVNMERLWCEASKDYLVSEETADIIGKRFLERVVSVYANEEKLAEIYHAMDEVFRADGGEDTLFFDATRAMRNEAKDMMTATFSSTMSRGLAGPFFCLEHI